jgi:hypothetical protein
MPNHSTTKRKTVTSFDSRKTSFPGAQTRCQNQILGAFDPLIIVLKRAPTLSVGKYCGSPQQAPKNALKKGGLLCQ